MADRARLGMGGAAGEAAAGRVTIVLADLAREVVVAAAPEQLELFAAVTVRWEAGDVPGRRRWGWMGGSVGSGIDPAVASEIIYPLLTGALGQVLGVAAVVGWRRRWWRRRRHSDVPTVPQVRVTLDASQIDVLRLACISHGVTLGLSRSRATVLADAVHGALGRAMAESSRPA